MPSTDFTSADFDAALALATPGLQPPRPAIRALDNLAQCRVLLQPAVPTAPRPPRQRSGRREVTASSSSAPPPQPLPPEPAAAAASSAPTPTRAALSDPFVQRVAATAVRKSGPLAVLAACLTGHRRVRVVVRGAHDVRGVCVGLLAAFDRHHNLVLRDVNETFVVVDYGPRSRWARAVAAGSVAVITHRKGVLALAPIKSPHGRSTCVLQRQVPQLFVRGDSVVCVSAADIADLVT